MKILSAKQVVPQWQREHQIPVVEPKIHDVKHGPRSHPLSVLPEAVQDQLREGGAVSIDVITPVPTR